MPLIIQIENCRLLATGLTSLACAGASHDAQRERETDNMHSKKCVSQARQDTQANSQPTARAYKSGLTLTRAVMMSAGSRLRVDHHRTRSELLRTGTRIRDRRCAVHAGRLRSIDIEFVRARDADAVQPPAYGRHSV